MGFEGSARVKVEYDNGYLFELYPPATSFGIVAFTPTVENFKILEDADDDSTAYSNVTLTLSNAYFITGNANIVPFHFDWKLVDANSGSLEFPEQMEFNLRLGNDFHNADTVFTEITGALIQHFNQGADGARGYDPFGTMIESIGTNGRLPKFVCFWDSADDVKTRVGSFDGHAII